jgi:hypothetical protein
MSEPYIDAIGREMRDCPECETAYDVGDFCDFCGRCDRCCSPFGECEDDSDDELLDEVPFLPDPDNQ